MKPFYKEWQFWAACVGCVILLIIFSYSISNLLMAMGDWIEHLVVLSNQ